LRALLIASITDEDLPVFAGRLQPSHVRPELHDSSALFFQAQPAAN
jgi:hypothetical protein